MQPHLSAAWQRAPLTQLTAVLLGAGPVYAQAIYGGFVSQQKGFTTPTLQSSIEGLVIMLGLFGTLIVALHIGLCGDSLSTFNKDRGYFWSDLLLGVLAGFGLMGMMLLFGLVLRLLGFENIPEANRQIGGALAADPWMLLFWLGPIAWLQAGLFEELVRSFVLIRLWNVWPRARLAMVLISALPFGLAHLYQGWVGVAGTMLIGILLGRQYMKHQRLLPLVVAHAIYDSFVLLILAGAERYGVV